MRPLSKVICDFDIENSYYETYKRKIHEGPLTKWLFIRGKLIMPNFEGRGHYVFLSRNLSRRHYQLHINIECMMHIYCIHKLYKSRSRASDTARTIYPADVVLVEGILTFYQQEVRDLFDMKLFVDTDSDTRLSRRGKYAHV